MEPARTAAELPFVGRTAEIDALRASIGQGRLALVCGEAGIGKTRIAEELARETPDATVLWGRCWEGDGAPAFWPWTQIVRAYLRAGDRERMRELSPHVVSQLASLVPEIRDLVAAPELAPSADPARARFQLFDAVTSFVRVIAADASVVLVLEDLQWSDTTSLALLQYVAQELGSIPALIVATCRDVDATGDGVPDAVADLGRHGHCTRLTLHGLDETDVRTLVASRLPTATDAMLADVMRKTAGNPFFLTQLLQLMTREPAPDSALPDGVRDTLLRRLRALPETHRALLDAAAVIGDEFPMSVLHALELGPADALLHTVGDAITRRILAASPDKPGRYRFAHALIRDVLYDELPLARRVELHARVGVALERCYGSGAHGHAAELAHHFLVAAVRDEGRRAVAYAIDAGDHASRVVAHEAAAGWYRTALDTLAAWQPGEQREAAAVRVALGEALVRAGRPKDAEQVFHDAIALARLLDLPAVLARAALGLGEIDRSPPSLEATLDEALAALDPADSRLRARVLSLRAILLYWDQPAERKRALSDDAVAMARRLGDMPTLTYVLTSRLASLSGPDDVEARLATAVEMAELGERSGDRELGLVGRGWAIADRFALGEIARPQPEVETFAQRARAVKHPYLDWWVAVLTTMCAVLEGRLADAEPLAHEALGLGQHAVATDALNVFAGQLYALRMEQERLRELEPVMRSIVDQQPSIAGARCALALLYAETNRAAEAAAELDQLAANDFAALPRNPEWLSSMAVLAQTTALLPGAPHAARLYELLEPYEHLLIVSGLGALCAGAVPQFLGMLARALERWDVAERHFARALDRHTTMGGPIWTAYTHYERAVLAHARGDHAGAETAGAEAAAIGDAIGMPRLARKLHELGALPATDDAPSPPPAVDDDGDRVGVLRREGDYWTVAYTGPSFHLKDSVGLRYIAMLVRHPVREFLAADLVATVRNERNGSTRDAGPMLDEQAKRDYRTRLETLRSDIAEAERTNQVERAALLHAEEESLTAELVRAIGLGGRDRKAAAPLERARVSATRAIQAAVRRIGKNDPALGRHLAGAIRTGTFCSYTPDPGAPVAWDL